MKIIHMHKLGAIMEMKLKALFSKNFIIMPLFDIGITFMMRMLYSAMSDTGLTNALSALALTYGAVMNITTSGIYCVSAALAEEKEKHTLRALMTSSVNGLEFFLGSLLPVILLMLFVNSIIVPISGASMDAAGWGIYIGISTLSAVASALIGMIFGIFSKNQVTAASITSPALLVFMMIPMFSSFSKIMQQITDFLFTGVLMQTINYIVTGNGEPAALRSVLVILAEILFAIVCFLVIYRKTGYDSE